MKKKFFDNIIESQSFANAALPTFNFNIFLAAIAALYLGSSLTDWLTDSVAQIRAIGRNSVNFQARTSKFCMVVFIHPSKKNDKKNSV